MRASTIYVAILIALPGISNASICRSNFDRVRLPSMTITPEQAAQGLAVGYHASPALELTELDPNFSRNTNRYGRGVYLYERGAQAIAHALSIRQGKIKYDSTPRLARIYGAIVDASKALDVDKIYSIDELSLLVERRPQLLGVLELTGQAVSGEAIYRALVATFQNEGVALSLSRGVVGEDGARDLANSFLIEIGINAIIGRIPDPNDKNVYHRAFIVLTPIPVQ